MAVGIMYLKIILVASIGITVATKKKGSKIHDPPSQDISVKFEFDAPPVDEPSKKIQAPADLFNYEERRKSMGNLANEEPPKQGVNEMLANEGGEKFYNRATRPGTSVETHRCNQITSVPRHLTFITRYNHYQKYTHAYGIPIVGTNRVRDAALKRACYVVRFLFADRQILRKYMYRYFGRVGIMAYNEGTTSIPEHRHLGRWWDTRARGLGGTLHIPISTGGEENLLCERSRDRYPREDIFLHEFSHGVQEIAVRGGGIPGYFGRLTRAYNYAKSRGLWRATYSMSTVQEYFAEGVQSFFEVNDYSATPNGIHGPINTRAKLRTYDPTLYNLVREVFPCMNRIHDRCARGTPPAFRMNCDGRGPQPKPKPGTKTTTTKKPPVKPPNPNVCTDTNQYCATWAKRAFCAAGDYLGFMNTECRKSCGCCTDKSVHCKAWSKKFCKPKQPYYDYMIRSCKKSCSVCDMYQKQGDVANSPPTPV